MRKKLLALLTIAVLAGCGPMPGGGGGGTTTPGGGGAPAATPAPPPGTANVSGNWVVSYQANPTAGTFNFNAPGSLVLNQRGNTLTGTYTAPDFSADVTGTVRGRALRLTIGPATLNNRTTTIIHRATVAPDNNSASGSVAVTSTGESQILQMTGQGSLTRR